MAGAGLGAEADLGPGAALDTTNLYRAVTQAELDDILKTDGFVFRWEVMNLNSSQPQQEGRALLSTSE
jgi:hypothetical protein